MRRYLAKTLAGYRAQHPNIHSTIFETDFIHDAVRNLKLGKGTRFTHAIQNPPYAKINSKSEHRLWLREVGVETVNLYTAFVALTILLMESQGEIVAIIPEASAMVRTTGRSANCYSGIVPFASSTSSRAGEKRLRTMRCCKKTSLFI